jgi:hypothetical protein
MYTYMLYQAERPKTAQEQRELDAINGEIALAIMRPFRWLRRSRRMARPIISVTRSDRGAAPSGQQRNGAARADGPAICQSHHSLEDIYLELINHDEAAPASFARCAVVPHGAESRRAVRLAGPPAADPGFTGGWCWIARPARRPLGRS